MEDIGMGGKVRLALAIAAVAVGWSFFGGKRGGGEVRVEGKADESWASVRKAFEANFAEGLEKEGASLAVYHQGKLVVDLWGGYADAGSHRPWRQDTLGVIFSCTKSLAALSINLLAHRGAVNLDAPVAKYWPEFAANGKAQFTVADLLEHRTGLAALEPSRQITAEMVRPNSSLFAQAEAILAAQAPMKLLRKDGRAYHAITFGFLIDALLRRVDPKRRTLSQFIREELSGPVRAEFFLGLPKTEFHRMARCSLPSPSQSLRRMAGLHWDAWALPLSLIGHGLRSLVSDQPQHPFLKMSANPAFFSPGGILSGNINDPEILGLEIASANGVATARGLAAVFAALGEGKIIPLDSPLWARMARLRELSPDDIFEIMGAFNVGFMASDGSLTGGHAELGHSGYGGSNAKLIPDLKVAYAYLTNGMGVAIGDADERFARIQAAIVGRLTS